MKLGKILLTLSLGLSLCACRKKTEKDITTTKNTVKTTKKTVKTTKNKVNTTTNNTQANQDNGIYKRVGNTIYFGQYPQTLVTDTTTTSALTELAGTRGTSSWSKIEKSVNNASYTTLRYKDIDYDGSMYRVIDLIEYINYKSSETRSYDNYPYQRLNGYIEGELYCFKFEDIKWDILKESDGKAVILSSLTLDASCYEKVERTTKWMHNGGDGYANNYSLSDIRKWLNDYFYDNAFNELQKSIIEETTVYNHKDSTGNIDNTLTCINTLDNVFILSVQEVNEYMPSKDSRKYNTNSVSDYAKCLNASTDTNWGSYWLLRSPHDGSSYTGIEIETVNANSGDITSFFVSNQFLGIKPAITITL